MKILYIANARIPTEKAHGVQIMKMCEALARQGAQLELILPKRVNPIREEAFDYYKVERLFSIVRIACLDLLFLSFFKPLSYWIESVSFGLFLWFYFLSRRLANVIYTRDLLSVAFLPKHQSILVYEVHNLPQKVGWFYRHLLKKIDKLVVISHGLKEDFIKLGFEPQKILVAPDGVDIKQFSIADSPAECRKRLGLPLDKKIAVYTGHLYLWKGAFTALEAAKHLPEVLFIFVGGTKEDIELFKFNIQYPISNIQVVGHRPHFEIPYWLKAADVLLLPNSAKDRISARYTSPMKLFEYMASGAPIVASDLPSIREILSPDSAVLVKPDNAPALSQGINKVLLNKDFADKIARQAQTMSLLYSWNKRAENISFFLIK